MDLELYARLDVVGQSVAELERRLNGDPARQKLSEPDILSIGDRVGAIRFGHWGRSIAAPGARCRLWRVYRCQVCGAVVPPNTPAIRQVVETRRREYPFRQKAHQFKKEGRIEKTDDPGGVGREIVREILVCAACHQEPSARDGEGLDPPALAMAA